MNDLFLFLLGLCFIVLIVGLVKPKFVVRWGEKEKRNRKSVLKYYGLGTLVLFILASITMPSENNNVQIADNKEEQRQEIKQEVKEDKEEDKQEVREEVKEEVREEDKEEVNEEKKAEQVEVEDENKKEIKDNDLFNKVYYKIANRDQAHEKNAIINYLEANEFIIEEDKDLNTLTIKDKAKQNGDYVFIWFDEMEDDSSIELISSISYFLEEEELEVIFANYSPNKDVQYDKLRTHKIGESNKDVNSIDEQILFLKETKNEHKAIKDKASENKKDNPVELDLNVEESIDDGKVIFKVSTNLPDNTTGSITLINKSIDYTTQDKFEVKDGKAEAGPFSLKGKSLPSGTYEVSVSTPLAKIQPDDVFIEVGEDYSNYTGDQFDDGDMGRNIRYSFEISIP